MNVSGWRRLRGVLLLAGTASSLGLAQPMPPPGYPPPPPPPGYYPPPPPPPGYYPAPPPGYYPAPAYPAPVEPPRRGRIEIGGFVGYQLSTDAGTCCGTINIDDSIDFGATLSYQIRPSYAVELLWIYVPTKVRFDSNGLTFPSSAEKSNLTINYIQLGGMYGLKRGRLEPFFSLTAGVIIVAPDAVRLTDGTTLTADTQAKFAFTAGGGLKVWINEMFAVRLEVRALVPVYFSSTTFYAGTAGGGVGLSGGIPYAQFDFTGGLVVAL
jgi:hypothetical protein